MSNKHTFKWITLIIIVIISGLAVGAITYIYAEVSEFDKVFAQNVTVNQTDIGGLTREDAYQKIKQSLAQQVENKNLILHKGDVSVTLPFKELGSEYNIDEVLDRAYAVGHQGNVFQKFQYIRNTPSSSSPFELKYIYDKEKIHAMVEESAAKFHISPIDATISRQNRQFVITPEKEGQELNLAATVEKIFTALDTETSVDVRVEAITESIPVKYTTESFKDIQNVVASFTTSYNNSDANRNINLQVAASKINTMLLPGEIFSLGKQLEPINYNAGYRSSKVIINGKLEDGIGGGICQIASTLYNSLLLTNFEITMRQNHSLPVAYVPLGRDATYVSNAIDFKFKNNTDYPMFIESYCENNKVYVNLFAHPSIKPEYEVKFDSVTTEVINPPAPKYVDDAQLSLGSQIEEVKALSGKKVKLYRLFYKDGNLIKKELVNNSYYRPRAATIRIGIKADTPVFNSTVPPSESQNIPSDDLEEQLIPDSFINDLNYYNPFE